MGEYRPTWAAKRSNNVGSNKVGALSPGQTMEQSWIPHAILLDVNVQVLAKHYPTLLDEIFKFKLALNLKIWRQTRKRKALVVFIVLEVLEGRK